MAERIVIVGAGPAGRAAAALLPQARIVARPDATAWHAEPGRLWILERGQIEAVSFDILVVAAPVLHLLLALGCRTRSWRPAVDAQGRSSVPGVFAAGAVLGAATESEAARHGRIVAQAVRGRAPEGTVTVGPPPAAVHEDDMLAASLGITKVELRDGGSVGIATVLRHRTDAEPIPFAPAVPIPFAALAAHAGERPPPRPLQIDEAPA
jgi:pyruvate/2-oxoglutarate dehydrogenase complex dihydrolipoamide dehydrogenase (E3) component